MKVSANKLGEIRAETDKIMLDKAFLETADYRTLIESADKVVVIGRRGTGKSALTYKLESKLEKQDKTYVLKLVPEEDQVIGLRPILKHFNEGYDLIRAAVKIAWEAILHLVILNELCKHYKFQKVENSAAIKKLVSENYDESKNIAFNLRKLLIKGMGSNPSPEESIAELSEKLLLRELKDALARAYENLNNDVYVLIDSLDEGYYPDTSGIAYIAGIIQGTLNVNSTYERVRPILFVRDNMFRAVAEKDPDYSRNIEGTSLRLHWEEQQLLNLVASRLKVVFEIEQENDIRVWNKVVASELKGREGFRKCLQLTLYRPRDLLALLNQAFFVAAREGHDKLISSDLEATSKYISKTRLEDLQKEYAAIFPSIKVLTESFTNYKPEFTTSEAESVINKVIMDDDYPPEVQQDLFLIDDPKSALRSLYSIGFIGIKDRTTSSFSFCHDGRTPDVSMNADSVLLIHPCYQIALNLVRKSFDPDEAREIHDDYEIEIESASQEERNKKIGRLVSQLNDIHPGDEDFREFEDWCLEAVRICFAGALRNVESNPNKDSAQRRDIVATNCSDRGFWRRVLDDYGSREIIFEVKNYKELRPADFRQLASYLGDAYGKIGFFITRAENKEPDRDKDLVWIREIYNKQDKKLIVILPAKIFVNFLDKIRNPQKHDAIDKILDKLLTTYIRIYLNENMNRKKSARK
ncbi:P-loop ATPase, Sll1717 family [Thiohalophilus sp.]|uniref:P-loop ATPase, Sll1717 family n=1 Tax=Thiohalophilus sp. TaxID=3028392 RepID=UPI002ACE9F23|nr:ATP-binding protein [Thiohalophilus sp.]MDZ7805469.1 ATP-binding protein [Thiohalophilus sp.]